MHVARKIVSFLLTSGVACALLAACGGSTTTPSVTPPTVGTFVCPVQTTNTTGVAGVEVICTSSNALGADLSAISTYTWSFGDQTTTTNTPATTGNPVTHIYLQPGFYNVTLSVTDDHGTSASRSQIVSISVSNATAAGVTADSLEAWAWISGSKYANSVGVFETQFTANPQNQPSARQSAASWTSPQGKLWMFGGTGYDSTGTIGVLNDLWVFDPAPYCATPTNATCTATGQQWTWVSGSNRANTLGNFGTVGITSATNVISARGAMAQWVDPTSGKFWLFGGSGYDINNNASYLNDLWVLDPQTGEATWEAGSGVGNSASVGTQGAGASSSNSPAGRAFATTWVDKNGVFWLFGGQTINTSGTVYSLNDLWSYDPNAYDATKHPNGKKGWVWVAGTSGANIAGKYPATAGINSGAATNYPGARVSAQAWTDTSGNLWLFGGNGYDTNAANGSLNDLWKYNTTTGIWTWVAGSNTVGAAAVYGTQKTAAAGNTPSARVGTSGWVDTSGNFWLFGGSGSDSTGTASTSDGGGALNELWTFNPTTQLWTWMGGVDVAGTAGVYATSAPSATPPTAPFNTPGSRVWSISWVDGSGNFWLFGGAGLDSQGTSGYLNDLWTVQLTTQPN